MKHFSNYPSVEYDNKLSVNILVRGKIRDAILEKSALYYKHTVRNGERPDIISTKYYGNPKYTWAIFYANNMFHPVLDWPLDYQNFSNFLTNKYGSVERSTSTIHHYELVENDMTYIISESTYKNYLTSNETALSESDRKNINAVSNYDFELRENENKRNILILDQSYLYQIDNELKNLFK